MSCIDNPGTSVSGEASLPEKMKAIPMEHWSALYIAIKKVETNRKEALRMLRTREEGNELTVFLKHWKVRYLMESDDWQLTSLEYVAG